MSTIFGEPFTSMVQTLKGNTSEYEVCTAKEKYRTETSVKDGAKTVRRIVWEDGDVMFEAEDRKTETLALVWVRENGHLGGYRYRTPSADQLEPDQKTKDKIWELFSPEGGNEEDDRK